MESLNEVVSQSNPGNESNRRARQADRLARILRVLQLIQSRGQWNAKSIAQELEVTERTIYRDLDTLEFAGVPYYYDKQAQSYRVRSDYRFPIPNLTVYEIIGQAVATSITSSEGLDVAGTSSQTTQKIAASSKEEVQQLLHDAQRLISVVDLKLADHSQHQETIRTIQSALLNQKQLTGIYETPYEPQPFELTLNPIRLCLIKDAWYLIAQSTESDEPKTYRVARFKSLKILDTISQVPDQFDLKEYLGNAWAVYRGSPSYEVEIKFTPDASKIVTETIWHHTQKAHEHPDGSVSLCFTVDGLEEICNWLLSWSACSQVVKPEELREMLVAKLRLALELNQK